MTFWGELDHSRLAYREVFTLNRLAGSVQTFSDGPPAGAGRELNSSSVCLYELSVKIVSPWRKWNRSPPAHTVCAAQAHQVHFDSAEARVVKGVMGEAVGGEISLELRG